MLYLNHAGTSWPKPAPVQRAVIEALACSPANWASSFAGQHRRVAESFGVQDPACLVLTPGCTAALSVGIRDLPWQPGDQLVTSSWEHHALLRPVLELEARGVEHRRIPPAGQDPVDLDALEAVLVGGKVRLIAMTAAANVTGALLPIVEISALARRYGAQLLVDAAQLAGWVDLDVVRWDVDMLAFAGHKGPQAPWGVGGLYMRPGSKMAAPRFDPAGPRFEHAPGYCDTGSVDRLALAGLVAGLDWLAAPAQHDRLARARAVIAQLRAGLVALPGVEVLGPSASQARLPTLALRVHGRASSHVAAALAERGVLVSGGMQCASMAHQTLGSYPDGAVRVSVGPGATSALVEPVRAAFAAVIAS